MLQGMTWASPPAFLMPSATSWQASALRLEITTFAPSFANSSADERPMPRLEPVMTATFPVRSNGVFFIVVPPRASHTAVVARLDRAIQYAAALVMSESSLEYWIPAFAGDDSLS